MHGGSRIAVRALWEGNTGIFESEVEYIMDKSGCWQFQEHEPSAEEKNKQCVKPVQEKSRVDCQ